MTSASHTTKFVGFGDPVLDIIAGPVSFDFLQSLDMHPGGCTSIDDAQAQRLCSALNTNAGTNKDTITITKVPGGSAANVMKVLGALIHANSASTGIGTATDMLPHPFSFNVAFMGMIGQDQAGDEYRAMLESHHVHPLLLVSDATVATAATASCYCFITPDGQRTMRTYLGAAQHLTSPQQVPSSMLETILDHRLHASPTLPPTPSPLYIHFEGYTSYKPQVTEHILRLAKQHNIPVSLDLASFEVVKGNWEVVRGWLEAGFISILFCNQDEVKALEECINHFSVEKYLAQYVDVLVMTRGAEGSEAFQSSTGCRAFAPAERVTSIEDTVGAGDYFAGGFLYAWGYRGGSLQQSCACGNAAGAAAVRAVGANVGKEEMERLIEKMETILT